jgi:hypothetical protein
MIKNRSVIGIDQTGAVDARGRPKKLPVAVILDNTIEFTYIDSLSSTSISALTGGHSSRKAEIALDCVLGLPRPLKIKLRDAIHRTRLVEKFGRAPASQFFRKLGGGRNFPRKIERIAKANSVFRELPYQKNIQTGTFRFWKELAIDPDWYCLPHVETVRKGLVPIFEAYPSHSWRSFLGSSKREPLHLDKWMRNAGIELLLPRDWKARIRKDPNLADAAVIAMHLHSYSERALRRSPDTEGWILGFE